MTPTYSRRAGRLALVAVLALLGVLTFGSAASASGGAESSFVSKLNAERAQRGLPALSVDGQLAQVARDWSGQMVANGGISHRPNLRAVVAGSPAAVGENVGRSVLTGATEAQLVDRIHRAFMDSAGHRQNVLGDWSHVGVGVRVTDNGSEMWVTVNFKAAAAPAPEPKPAPEPAPAPAPEPEPEPEPVPEPSAQSAGASEASAPVGAEPAADAGTAQDPDAADEAAAGVGLVSTTRGLLSPAIRAHFALHDPPPLPRQLAGYLTAV